MELKVFWTDSAIEQLDKIFDFYKNKSGILIANKIINGIVDKTILLENLPRIGQIEELLGNKKNEYRYLIEGNYKIIYWIEESLVKIATVFDCRQNPIKLKKIK
jgi:toxin ParE1/3/4